MMKDALAYYVKAFIVFGLLTVIGVNASILPLLLIPFILLFYAALPTIGLSYTVSVKRIYKQFKYAPDGKLGSFNRKWFLKLSVIFSVSLFSAIFFIVNAPCWGLIEWSLIWGIAIIFYPLSKIVGGYLKTELMPRFIKASSIRAGAVFAVVAACIVFLIITANIPVESADRLSEAIRNRELHFQDSPIILLSDFDKVATFLNTISAFGVALIASEFFIVGLVFRLIAFASMLFGFVGILGCCMLNRSEVKSVFQLLPAFDESERLEENQPILKRYIIAPLILWLALTSVLAYAEIKTEEIQQTTGTTPISDFIDNRADAFVRTVEWAEDVKTATDEFVEDRNELASRYKTKLNNLLTGYYDACEEDIDSYLDWYYGVAGQVTNALKFIPIAKDGALSEFNSKVAEAKDTDNPKSKFKHQYDNYRSKMNELIEAYNKNVKDLSSGQPILSKVPTLSFSVTGFVSPDQTFSLWPSLNSGNDKDRQAIAEKILPDSGGSANREDFKKKLIELVENEKQKSLGTLNAQFEIIPSAA